jgi:outer membrane scaffolding protein for murein synthesis (MipA/OmpV family)
MTRQKVVKQSNFVPSEKPTIGLGAKQSIEGHLTMVDRDLKQLFLYTNDLAQISSGIVIGAGAGTIKSISGSASTNAGFLPFVLSTGTTAFVPYFASSST